MNIRAKKDGAWVYLSSLTDHLGVLDVTISRGRAAGDINGDGTINYEDALLIGEYQRDPAFFDSIQLLAADVYEPELGQITDEDATAIGSYSVDMDAGYVGRVISGENWSWVSNYMPEGSSGIQGRYVYTIKLLGIQPQFSIIGLLDTNTDGVFEKFVCDTNEIKLIARCIPTKPVHASLIYTAEGASSSIFLMGGMTDKQQQQIISTITAQLPVKVAADGYTDIANQRPIKNIHNKRDGNKLEITYTLEGDRILVDVINLDATGRPIGGTSNGKEFTIDWEGL